MRFCLVLLVLENTLAVVLFVEDLRNGITVYYTRLPNLISDLQKSQAQGRLESYWKTYLRLAVRAD